MAAFFSALTLVLQFTACDCPSYHHRLRFETLLLIPYNTQTVLEMQDSAGHRVRFEYQDSMREMFDRYMNENSCVQDYSESYRYNLHSDSLGLDLFLAVSQSGHEEIDGDPYFSIGIRGSSLHTCEVPIRLCDDPTLSPPCQDGFQVGNQTYDHVMELNIPSGRDTSANFPAKVWYVPYRGIIKIALHTGAVWELVN